MNISKPFIHRPVATTLLTVAVALAGAIAFRLLPISPLPQVDFPTISVGAVAARREPGNDGCRRSRPRSSGSSAASPVSPR